MRAIAMLLLFLSIALTCYADDDPLESLNSVPDTLATMEKSLEAQAWQENDDAVAVGMLEHVEGSLNRDLEPKAAGSRRTAGPVRASSARVGDMVPVPGPEPTNCALPAQGSATEAR